jgi:hypothetical protein
LINHFYEFYLINFNTITAVKTISYYTRNLEKIKFGIGIFTF